MQRTICWNGMQHLLSNTKSIDNIIVNVTHVTMNEGDFQFIPGIEEKMLVIRKN